MAAMTRTKGLIRMKRDMRKRLFPALGAGAFALATAGCVPSTDTAVRSANPLPSAAQDGLAEALLAYGSVDSAFFNRDFTPGSPGAALKAAFYR